MPGQSRRPLSSASTTSGQGGPGSGAHASPGLSPYGNAAGIELLGSGEGSGAPSADARVSRGPFAAGEATRGDFVWALALERKDLGLGDGTRQSALDAAQKAGILTKGKEDQAISRAEGATIVLRALKLLGGGLTKGEIAYFTDVSERRDWFFEEAHLARRWGLFQGGGDNRFRGNDALSTDEAKVVVQRAAAPKELPPEAQSPGMTPMLEPADALTMLDEGRDLSADEIAEAREEIAALPEEQRAAYYRKVAAAVSYRSQRDNKGGAGHVGDEMCQLTSLAMTMNQMGVGADESGAQLEDQLNGEAKEKGLGDILDKGTRGKLAQEHGLTSEVLNPLYDSSGKKPYGSVQEWLLGEIRPRLEAGSAAMMGIKFGEWGHVVRLEWVEDDGVVVDDPLGKLSESAYRKASGGGLNATTSSEGDGALGEDNTWDWATVSDLVNYVHVIGSGG